jgi:hypothetical protein
MNIKFSFTDFIIIGVFALVFIWLANWGLTKAGLSQYKA